MTATVRMSGSLPGEDRNGLADLATVLVDNPEDAILAVVVLETRTVLNDIKGGASVPTVAVTAIEPIVTAVDARDARRLLRRAHERRTNRTQLPLELEQEMDVLVGDVELSSLPFPDGQPLPAGPPAEELPVDTRLAEDDDTFGVGFSDL